MSIVHLNWISVISVKLERTHMKVWVVNSLYGLFEEADKACDCGVHWLALSLINPFTAEL